MATLQMGPDTYPIPLNMFRDNRKRVCDALLGHRTIIPNAEGTYIFLQGGSDISLYNTDVNYHFRQEPFFTYFFGVREPDVFGVVCVGTGDTTLFIPNLPDEYATWMGRLPTCADVGQTYEVYDVRHSTEISQFFETVKPSLILTLRGVNSDSGFLLEPGKFDGIEKYSVNSDILFRVASECRVIKSPDEISVLRYVAKVSSEAHKRVMKTIRPGDTEYSAESTFLHHCYSVGGCRHVSYTCICGSGDNSAILHYGHAAAPNDRTIQNGDMLLFDMGANYFGYAADITCSYPANGKFTDDQRRIYEAVLASNLAVFNAAKEGVLWSDMHRLANRVLLEQLKRIGVVKGDVTDMMVAGINGIFQPHGLGHLLGLDVHDVGGYNVTDCQPRPTDAGLTSLRFNRILKAGMYVTIEPGCYFIDHLLDKALSDPVQSKFLVPDVVERFRGFGGVRIEDDVLITKTGCENFSIVPRTVEEIETFMASD